MVLVEVFKRSVGTDGTLHWVLPFLKTETIKLSHCQAWKPSGIYCHSFLGLLSLVSGKVLRQSCEHYQSWFNKSVYRKHLYID